MAHNKSLADLRLEISKIEDQLGDISQRKIINGGTAESTPRPRVERNDRDSGIGSAQRGGLIPDTSAQSKDRPQCHEWGGARPKIKCSSGITERKSTDNPFLIDHGENITQRRRNRSYSQNDGMPDLRDERDTSPQRQPKKKIDIKPASFDGTNSWKDYKSHFDACAKINNWSIEEKELFLAVSLRGQAQGVLGDLHEDTNRHYYVLVKALEERFAPLNRQSFIECNCARGVKRRQSQLELGQAIRRLVNQAYPTAPGDVRETLAKDQFIDALKDQEIRIKIKQSRPSNLNSAVQLAVELESYYRTEQQMMDNYGQYRAVDVHTESHGAAFGNTLNSEMISIIKSLKDD